MRLLYSIVLALPLLAVDGQVLNQTTGKPQAGATVTLFKLGGSAGPEVLDSVKSGADGKFNIDKQLPPGPGMIQTAFDGVTYNHMLPPGRPTSGIKLDVFNTSGADGRRVGGGRGWFFRAPRGADLVERAGNFVARRNLISRQNKPNSHKSYRPVGGRRKRSSTKNCPSSLS